MLRLTVSQSVCLGVKSTPELVTRYYFMSENCSVVSVGLPLWREVGSVSCQSLSKCNLIYMLQSHMFYVCTIYARPLSANTQYSRSCSIISSLRYNQHQSESESELHYNWQSVSQYVLVSSPIWEFRPEIYFFFWKSLSCHLGAPSLTRGRVCPLSI
jgi:hypothetical protein